MAAQSSGELPIGTIVENRNRDTAWFAMIDKDWNSGFTKYNFRG
jgi:hypothetical protein